MRHLLLIFLISCVAFACVKPKTKDPVPVLEFKDVQNMQLLPASATQPIRDTAVLVIGYQDGDGDIFRNTTTDGPNFFYTILKQDETTGKMVRDSVLGSVSATNVLTIRQPADGYYKGKSIEGDLYVPLKEFRSSTKVKVIQFQCFMVDMKNHTSNVVTSPVYKLSF